MSWRDRTGSPFTGEKTAVTASRGMAVTNHPLASAARILRAHDHERAGRSRSGR